MKIYGLDFTSAPGLHKPITCAECRLDEDGLRLEELEFFHLFAEFEDFLGRSGPWVAGLDFPFGQPRRLVENIGWPENWTGYVSHVGGMNRLEFVEALKEYRAARPSGDKQHLRLTDRLANSRSPMMLYGVPVGKMFFEGAPRLLGSGASILPSRPTDDQRIILETYPALIARRCLGKLGYKNDNKLKQTVQQQLARQTILQYLISEAKAVFGFDIRIGANWVTSFTKDATGDQLDALLCAVQAGWAYTQKERNYGIPIKADPLEGWIVDPGLLTVHE